MSEIAEASLKPESDSICVVQSEVVFNTDLQESSPYKNYERKIGKILAPIIASTTILLGGASVAEARPYVPETVQGHQAWKKEAKTLKRLVHAGKIGRFSLREVNICKTQLERQPKTYSTCFYPVAYNSIIKRAQHKPKQANWLKHHPLNSPGKVKLHDRAILYLHNKPAKLKQLKTEINAGAFYKAPKSLREIMRVTNDYECGGGNICTNGPYQGAYQSDQEFDKTYNVVAYTNYGRANNWSRNMMDLLFVRGYYYRGAQAWPSTFEHYNENYYPFPRVPANNPFGENLKNKDWLPKNLQPKKFN